MQWYESWFDTHYYHLLYGKRDEKEAAFFIDNLLNYLHLPAGARCWDLNCGKGRHALHLNRRGYHVTGTDLSEQSVSFAKQSEGENLRFYRHDMRNLFYANYFHAVFNLFTSFGYFRNRYEDQKVFQSVFSALLPGGRFVLDFFNPVVVLNCLKEVDEKVVGDVVFDIRKKIENNLIIKEITVHDKGEKHHFREEVKIFTQAELALLGEDAGLRLDTCFGDYSLQPFSAESSERLILIFVK